MPNMTRDQLRLISPAAAQALDEEDARKAGKGAQAALRALRGEPPAPPSSSAPAPIAPETKAVGAPRVRQRVGPEMNKTETQFLEYLNRTGCRDDRIRFNAIRFELANGLHFKPDFTVNGVVCYEAKGPWASRDAFPRLKMAARLYPEFTWYLATSQTSRMRGVIVLDFNVQLILP